MSSTGTRGGSSPVRPIREKEDMLFEALYRLVIATLLTGKSFSGSELISNSPISLIAVSAVSLTFTMARAFRSLVLTADRKSQHCIKPSSIYLLVIGVRRKVAYTVVKIKRLCQKTNARPGYGV
jgi:hypothetical protein